MIARPTSVQVGGKPYTIRIDPRLVLRDQNCLGICRAETQNIDLLPCLTVERQDEVLYHEILEAINNVWFQEKLDHDTITRLGEAWCQAMRSMGVAFDWSECLP